MHYKKVGLFRVRHDSKLAGRNTEYRALQKRLDEHTAFEMRGLGIKGTTFPWSSGHPRCSVYFLKNANLVIKYLERYAIFAPDRESLLATASLLSVDAQGMAIADLGQVQLDIK